MEELIKKTGNSIFKLVIVAAKRATEIYAGAPKLVEGNYGKPSTTALHEIAEGRVGMKPVVKQA